MFQQINNNPVGKKRLSDIFEGKQIVGITLNLRGMLEITLEDNVVYLDKDYEGNWKINIYEEEV